MNRAHKRIKKFLIGIVHFILRIIELIILTTVSDNLVPTVWIVAPPRSGTTLLYQVLIRCYNFAYISNFAAVFFKAPVLASWIAGLLFKSSKSMTEFESYYGRTANWWEPHEAGDFWYRWFPKGDYVYVPPNTISQRELKYLKKEIIGLSKFAKAPVLFKNVYNSMRIAPIVETFPNACFLVCRRNPLDTAQSILNGRINLFNDKSKWIGVLPKEINQIKDHPYWVQIAEQIYYTYQQIETDKEHYGSDKFFEVDYEQLCKNPDQVLREMENFFSLHHIPLKRKGELPEQFPFSTGKQVDDKDYELIQRATTKLWQ